MTGGAADHGPDAFDGDTAALVFACHCDFGLRLAVPDVVEGFLLGAVGESPLGIAFCVSRTETAGQEEDREEERSHLKSRSLFSWRRRASCSRMKRLISEYL